MKLILSVPHLDGAKVPPEPLLEDAELRTEALLETDSMPTMSEKLIALVV